MYWLLVGHRFNKRKVTHLYFISNEKQQQIIPITEAEAFFKKNVVLNAKYSNKKVVGIDISLRDLQRYKVEKDKVVFDGGKPLDYIIEQAKPLVQKYLREQYDNNTQNNMAKLNKAIVKHFPLNEFNINNLTINEVRQQITIYNKEKTHYIICTIADGKDLIVKDEFDNLDLYYNFIEENFDYTAKKIRERYDFNVAKEKIYDTLKDILNNYKALYKRWTDEIEQKYKSSYKLIETTARLLKALEYVDGFENIEISKINRISVRDYEDKLVPYSGIFIKCMLNKYDFYDNLIIGYTDEQLENLYSNYIVAYGNETELYDTDIKELGVDCEIPEIPLLLNEIGNLDDITTEKKLWYKALLDIDISKSFYINGKGIITNLENIIQNLLRMKDIQQYKQSLRKLDEEYFKKDETRLTIYRELFIEDCKKVFN